MEGLSLAGRSKAVEGMGKGWRERGKEEGEGHSRVI